MKETEDNEWKAIGETTLKNEKPPEIDTKRKKCQKCNTELFLNQFNHDRTRYDGYHPYCKSCCKILGKEIYIKQKISGIYKIVNKINKKYYVGSSKNISGCINGRWIRHKKDLNANIHCNTHLQRAWNKYGSENFKFLIIERNISEEKLLEYEQKYLDIAKTEKDKCYNVSFIAGRIIMTEKIKRKIGDANRGKKHSEETKKKISQNSSKYWLGKHLSEETKQKLSRKNSGKNHLFYKKNIPWTSGINNINYDYTIYNFLNVKTDENFIGTRNEFYKKYNIDNRIVRRLVRGIYKHYKGWTIK
jgi:group I intron endonuclease